MPESTCLHIQDRDSGPIRVVEIPWISVRIGRAAYCEVRLADRDVAEEACRLQRRGRTWHLVPLGPKGSILVQDRPIEGPYPLPFDVPFRIGSCCLTLRQNRTADPDWAMYETPSPSHAEWTSAASPASPPGSCPAPTGAASLHGFEAAGSLGRAPSEHLLRHGEPRCRTAPRDASRSIPGRPDGGPPEPACSRRPSGLERPRGRTPRSRSIASTACP